MLEKIKLALRLTTDAFDAELTDLINAAALDLGLVGIALPEPLANDALIGTAIVTYVRCHFGSPSDYDRLKASYDEQKAQLQTATGYGL